MLEEAGGVGRSVAVFGQEGRELIVGEAAGLGETVEALGDSDEGLVARPDDAGAVAVDDVGRDLSASEPHKLIVFKVTTEVEVLEIEGTEVGTFSNGGIEEELDGLHVGGPGGAEARVVRDIAAVSAAHAAVEGAVRGDFDLYLRVVVGGGTVDGFEAEVEPVHSG